MIEIKNILFPIDLTENASKILPYVLSVSESTREVLKDVIEDSLQLAAGNALAIAVHFGR
jgi:hypothetical protein